MKNLNTLVFFFLLILLFPTSGLADILVNDMLGLKGNETMISAETRGRFFPQGGKLVEFFINGKSLGKSLSGGDGIAYKQFIPEKTGLFHISARSGKDEGKGMFLSLNRGDKVIFIDIEGSLLKGLFSKKPRKGSQEVIKGLSKNFPVVFLQTGLISIKILKSWLKESRFVDLPVLPWREGLLFDEINKKGIKIKAIIGSTSVIESAKEYNPRSFSFEEGEDSEVVDNWEEIGKQLLKGGKHLH